MAGHSLLCYCSGEKNSQLWSEERNATAVLSKDPQESDMKRIMNVIKVNDMFTRFYVLHTEGQPIGRSDIKYNIQHSMFFF